MARNSKRPVRDQIPPEARRRAKRAGFSADADWYAGRDYDPLVDAEAPSGPPAYDQALATARVRHRELRHTRRQDRVHHAQAWLQSKAHGLVTKVTRVFAAWRPAGHR